MQRDIRKDILFA